jgi:hypothetical protein
MSGLGKSVDDYPDGVKLAAGEGQTHNEIHTNVFSFSGRNTQRLQQSRRPHMISLDPSTCVTFCNITSSLVFHTGPPELLKNRRRRLEGGEWQPIKISRRNLTYIPESTRCPSLLTWSRPPSYKQAIGSQNRARNYSGNINRCRQEHVQN